jgi:hypothetical protein
MLYLGMKVHVKRPVGIISVALLLSGVVSCAGSVGRYTDSRAEDSTAEARTRSMAPRSLVGAERDSVLRVMDSLMRAMREKTGLDSATFYDIPQGYVRVTNGDGSTYLRPATEEETKRMQGGAVPNDFGDIIAYSLDGQEVGKAGYKERGKPYVINTSGLPAGTYMLSIPGEKQMKKIVVQ